MNPGFPCFRFSLVSVGSMLIIIIIAGCFASRAAAQATVPFMRVEVGLQPIYVQVKDSDGKNVPGLTEKDFKVLENGKEQKIAFFDAGSDPVSIAILVDSSDTMDSSSGLGSAQAIAAQFMRTARAGDQIYAMDFTDQMGPFVRFTREQLLNPAGPTLSPAPSHGSALYDAIADALCHLRGAESLRQAVIVITDGVDQYSRIDLEQLIGLVRASRAQLFMIGLQSKARFGFQRATEPRLTLINGHDIDNPVVVFDRLMKESGAESFIPKSRAGLKDALQAVSSMLQSQYTLAYYPPKNSQKNSGKLRKIEVKVDLHKTHVFTRRFVGTQQNASEFVHFDEASCAVSPKFHPYPYEADVTRGPGGMIYRDNFSDPHSGWPQHEDSHYVSGGYELSNSPVPAGNMGGAVRYYSTDGAIPYGAAPADTPMAFRENVIAAYGPWWTDFRASVSVKIVSAAESHNARSQFSYATRPAAGLLFRMNPKGYYALLLSSAGKKGKLSAKLVRRDFLSNYPDNYTETDIVPWAEVERAPASETQLSVQASEDRISIFVDGQPVKTARDNTYSQGWVGFVISGPGHAIFRDLVVRER